MTTEELTNRIMSINSDDELDRMTTQEARRAVRSHPRYLAVTALLDAIEAGSASAGGN